MFYLVLRRIFSIVCMVCSWSELMWHSISRKLYALRSRNSVNFEQVLSINVCDLCASLYKTCSRIVICFNKRLHLIEFKHIYTQSCDIMKKITHLSPEKSKR